MILRSTLTQPKSANSIILICALWLTLFTNLSYFQKVLSIYDINLQNSAFLLSIVLFQFSLVGLLLSFSSIKYFIKPVLIVLLLSATSAAYFMQTFGVVINDDMIRNTLQTNTGEALDLVSLKLIIYLAVLGVLPSVWILYTPIKWKPLTAEIWSRLKLISLLLLLLIVCLGLFYKPYASFFREHKTVRLYSNPIYPIYSSVKYFSGELRDKNPVLKSLGDDARIPVDDIERELIILVVGETARWDHFSLNGYRRKTNPELEKETLFNFPRMRSCATSTALSLPCMFSYLTQDNFSIGEAAQTENVLDILNRAQVNILWRDNNSSSKGVADRVLYENYRDPAFNPVCDVECRDEGMLAGLDEFIEAHPQGDILVVLHQMGNHGPAYFKRYPKSFDVFMPSCQTAQLEDCSDEEIINAYDNAILYTDYFLSKSIAFLKQYSDRFETGLLYVSDHGESLGEQGIYLHGLPNFIAPEGQTHVPAFLWLGENNHDNDRMSIQQKSALPMSHDNIFHILLGLFEVNAKVYDKNLDILTVSKDPQDRDQ